MTRRLMFWVLMLIWLVWAICWHFALLSTFGPLGFGVLLFMLFGLLGWQVFGPPIQG